MALGQDLELNFDASTNTALKGDFRVRFCYATNELGTENLTLIENGYGASSFQLLNVFRCPQPGVDKWILRGGLKKSSKGFRLPFRAFKFNTGDGVKIACKVEVCPKKCEQVR